MVERILAEKPAGQTDLRATGVVLEDGTRVEADAVIVAPGREGAAWLVDECKRLAHRHAHQPRRHRRPRRGPRRRSWSRSPASLYESKLIYYTPSFDDPVRTFCMNPYGAVSIENYGDVTTVNGHSYADFKTDRTNFALLVSTDFTEPFDDSDRLRQVASPGSPTCSATTSSCSASATCSRGTARPWTASAAARCSRR